MTYNRKKTISMTMPIKRNLKGENVVITDLLERNLKSIDKI